MNRWISVKEKLPTPSNTKLVPIAISNKVLPAYYFSDGFRLVWALNVPITGVEFWYDLPEPNEEERSN